MGRFEIEANGKRYEVEAPSIEAAMAAIGGAGTNGSPAQRRDANAVDAGAPISSPTGAQPNALASAVANSGPVVPRSAERVPAQPDLAGATAATLSGIVNGIPVIGPAAQNFSDALVGTGAVLTGGNYDETVDGLRRRREELSAANPISSVAGNIAGGLGSLSAAGATTAGANALGLTGNLGSQMLNSGLSTLGLTTADNIVRGQAPTEALADAAMPSSIAAAVPVAGQVVGKGLDAAADAATRANQSRLTSQAIKNAPDAAALRSSASAMFDSATGGTPLAVSDNAYFRFLGGVQSFANKLRINSDNDPQATGLLSTLMRIADETSQGVAVDLKDLHLIRQLAGKVAGSSQGRDSALGAKVVNELDNFIQTLKPADILGGADPSQAANSLMNGISTWSRASKVGLIEEAVQKASTYKSGMENGLRLQFQAMLRNASTRKLFTAAERLEIEKVANGTAGSNLVTLLGKFGFGTNGAGNMLGGTIGSLGAASVLGPLGGIAAAVGGTGARALSEKMGVAAANRAAQTVATPNIPVSRQFSVPAPISGAVTAADLIARSALIGGN